MYSEQSRHAVAAGEKLPGLWLLVVWPGSLASDQSVVEQGARYTNRWMQYFIVMVTVVDSVEFDMS
jgi:hypothetical protein